jgi:hypothetical protein
MSNRSDRARNDTLQSVLFVTLVGLASVALATPMAGAMVRIASQVGARIQLLIS